MNRRVAKPIPLVGMKTHFPFQVAVCAWVDLLGYGAEISGSGYNPLSPKAKDAVSRIRQFHQIVADHSSRDFPTLVMNDGAVAYRDLSYRTRWPTYDFVQRAFALYERVQEHETRLGEPGCRMVIGTGFRLRGRSSQSSSQRGNYVKRLIDNVKTGRCSVEEAITKASKFRRNFDILPELQANFAFTKAYIAEQSGSRGGLPGPNCYLDDLVLDFSKLDERDIVVGERIRWQSADHNLQANFLEIVSVRTAKQTEKRDGVIVNHGPSSFRDAIEVAKQLTGDQKVLEALRKTRNSPRKSK